MPHSDLRRRLGELAQQFVDGVIAAIQVVPLRDVASEVGANGGLRRNPIKVSTAGSATDGAKRGRASAGENRAVRDGTRKLNRRSGSQIEQLRGSIVRALEGFNRPMPAADIARKIGGGVTTQDLSFPMAQLRKQKLVHKEGERTQAVYSLSSRGATAQSSAKAASGKRAAAKGATKKGTAKKSGAKKGTAKKGARKK